jgi:GNAT superfamily N-acetyltransferase
MALTRALDFRVATLDDVDVVYALVESAYRGESSRAGWTTEADYIDGTRTDVAHLRSIVEAVPAEILLAFDRASEDEVLLACCHVELRGDRAYFGLFAVAPTEQSHGIGSRVLDEAEHRVHSWWGCTRMEMHVIDLRSELIEWYERRGYRRTGETEPFPYHAVRNGRPRRDDLRFAVLVKEL